LVTGARRIPVTREEFNEEARRNAEEFRKELADEGVEIKVAVHDTDEDYFVYLVNQAVSYAYSNHSQVQALADIKALLLLGIDAIALRKLEAAFTPENTGERAYSEYFNNVTIPRLESLGDNCPPEVRAKVAQELKGAAPPRYTFRDLLRDTYRAYPGLGLQAGGSEVMARRQFFLRRVEEVLNSFNPKKKNMKKKEEEKGSGTNGTSN
jgi:hypothetical protein